MEDSTWFQGFTSSKVRSLKILYRSGKRERKDQDRKRRTIDAKGRDVRISDFRTCFQPRLRDSRNPRWPSPSPAPLEESRTRDFFSPCKRKRNWNRLFEIARRPSHGHASLRREKCKHGFAERATWSENRGKARMISCGFTRIHEEGRMYRLVGMVSTPGFRAKNAVFSFKPERSN